VQIEVLKLFCDVVRFHSFSRSAEENNITQSNASQAVQNLEERLGVKLIDRSLRPWKLTNEGKTFYEGCRTLVDRYYELEREVKNSHDETTSIVRVASIYSVGLRHMRYYVQKFSELHPKAHVALEYLHPERIYESVAQDQIDLGILSFPQPRRDIAVIPWKFEPMALACAPEHRLAHSREVDPSHLAGEKFVAFDRGLGIRSEIDRYLKQHGVEVQVTLEFDNIEFIKQAVEIGSGIALLPRPSLDREVAAGTLTAVPLSTKNLVRPLGIIHRRGKIFTPNVTRFVELLQNEKEPELSSAAAAPVRSKKPTIDR